MRPMRVAHQWNLFHKQAWLNERALCTPSSLSPRILSIIQLRVMRVSRGTKIHDFLLDKRLASIFERNFTIKILSLYYVSVVEIDWLIKWEEGERRVFFFLWTFERGKNFLAGRNKRPDQLCNRDSLDAALMTPYTVCRRRVIGQRLVRDACSSDVNRQEECRNLLFDANSSCHPARLLFPLHKDATTITHLRYEARDVCPSFFVATFPPFEIKQINLFYLDTWSRGRNAPFPRVSKMSCVC